MPRVLGRGAVAAIAATLLLAAPASAHPYFDPSEVPVDSLASVTLDIAHGCGVEDHDADDGQAGGEPQEAPTEEVAVEVPAAATHLDPADVDGWTVEVEAGDDGQVVVYRADEGTDEPAPRFDLDVVLTGEVGDEVHWRVMQSCDETTYRWVGTPDDPAEDPAVTMVLTEADEDAPPPEPADDATDDAADAEDPGTADDAEEPLPEEPTGPAESDGETEDDDLELAGDEGMPGWILIVVLVGTLVIAAVVLLKGRGARGADGPDGGGAGVA